MSNPDVTASFAAVLADEWVRAGVTHAVVAPGSRNAPLLLALARHGGLEIDVVLDERSAAFRALGIALATGRPALVCCTSGSAAANLHPAVIEAHHARVPLLVCTADRPPELRDCGAGQTIDQTHLYGRAVRWFHDPGPPEAAADAPARWRALAARAVAHAAGPPAGPVHLNLPLREPLVPTGGPLVDAPGRAGGAPWTRTTAAPRGRPDDAAVARIVEFVRAHPRGVLALGWGGGAQASTIARVAAATGWPVLADPISNLRTGAHAISTYEALLRSDGFARSHVPDLVVRVGAPLTSKVAQAWLDGSGAPTVVVDPQDAWLDPTGTASERIVAGADATLGVIADARTEPDADGAAWCASWQAAEHAAREAIDRVLDAGPACEGRIARDVAAAVPDGGALVVASSLPVRALEWCMSPRSGLRVFANRGANGIDGFVSTARGIARADRGPVVALCGDLCFLHDANGLLDTEGAVGATAGPTFVVIDNGGGGIFSYLPQHELPAAEFRRLFATPQVTDVVELARAHGVDAVRVDSVDDVDLLAAGGTRVVVVPVDPEAARDQHHRCWEAVARAAGRVDA